MFKYMLTKMIWYYIQFRIVDIRIVTFKGTIIIGCVKLSNLFLSMLRLEELWIFESSLFLCIDIFVQGGSILNPDITFLWQFFSNSLSISFSFYIQKLQSYRRKTRLSVLLIL